MSAALSPTMLAELRFVAAGNRVSSTYQNATYRALERRRFLTSSGTLWVITESGRNQLAAYR